MATVILASGPGGEFDYLVPEGMGLAVGCRVSVPLGRGNRSVVGYCVEVGYKSAGGRKLKAIADVLDAQPLLSPSMLRVTRWMADYYLCSWGQVLEAVVPAGVRHEAGTRDVTLLAVSPEVAARIDELKLSAKQAEVLTHLGGEPATALGPAAGRRERNAPSAPINALRKKGLPHGDASSG